MELIIIKDDKGEKKLCQIYTNEEYRKRGICHSLLEESFAILGTDKPKITIPQFRLDEFNNIISKYGWIESEELDSYSSKEIAFN